LFRFRKRRPPPPVDAVFFFEEPFDRFGVWNTQVFLPDTAAA